MALSTTAITSLERARAHLRLSPLDARYQADAILIYQSDTVTFSAATVAVSATTLTLDTTPNAGDTTFSLALGANDTIGELVTQINTFGNGWVAQSITHLDAASLNLVPIAATNALGLANRLVLEIVAVRDLELIIEEITDKIERYLKRHVVIRDFDELHVLNGTPIEVISLREPDVTEIERVSIDSREAFRATYNGADQSATIEITDAQVTLRSRGGTLTETPITFAANTTVAAVVTAINLVAGWVATTSRDGPSVHLVRTAAQDVRGVTTSLYTWLDISDFYRADYEAGLIWLDSAVWPYALRDWWLADRSIMVEYAAGLSATTAAVPDDIQHVALRLISTAWNERGIGSTGTIRSRSLGDYSETLLTPAELAGGGGSTSARNAWQDDLVHYVRMGA